MASRFPALRWVVCQNDPKCIPKAEIPSENDFRVPHFLTNPWWCPIDAINHRANCSIVAIASGSFPSLGTVILRLCKRFKLYQPSVVVSTFLLGKFRKCRSHALPCSYHLLQVQPLHISRVATHQPSPFPSWHIVQASKEPRTGAAPPVTENWSQHVNGVPGPRNWWHMMVPMSMTCRTSRFRINLLLSHGPCGLYLLVWGFMGHLQ